MLALGVGLTYGFGVGQYQLFPFHQLQSLKRHIGGVTAGDWRSRELKASQATFVFQRDVVMLGDSLTAGGAWGEMFPHVQPANRGVSGDTTEDVLARLDGVTVLRPRRVFLLLGVNDFARGDDPADVFGRYVQIVSGLRQAGAQVTVQSTLPCDPARHAPILRDGCPATIEKAAALNVMLQRYCHEQGLEFVDLWPAMADRNGLRPEFTGDGMHLTTAGYVAWRDVILRLVEPGARLPADVDVAHRVRPG